MKKVPLRKCVATGEQLPKKELIRIVRNKDYFKNHQMICYVYNFLKKIVEYLA